MAEVLFYIPGVHNSCGFCFSSLDDESHTESKLQHEQDKSIPSVSKRIVLGDTVCSMAGTADHAAGMTDLKGEKDLFTKTPDLVNEGTSELRHRGRGNCHLKLQHGHLDTD